MESQAKTNSEVYTPFYRKKGVVALFVGAATAGLAAVVLFYLSSKDFLYLDNSIVDGQKISVSSQYPGKIESMTKAEGSMVKKGELLVQLNDLELKEDAQRDETTLLYNGENAKLAEYNLEKAQSDFNRTQNIYKSGVISQSQYEQAEKELNNVKIQAKIAEVQVKAAKTQLNIINMQLKCAKIYAAQDGVVAKKWVSEGDVIQPSQALYTIYDLKSVSVLANVDETNIRNVHVGQEAFVTVDAYPGNKFSAKVISVFPCTASQLVQNQPVNSTGDFTKMAQYVSVRILPDNISNNGQGGRFSILPGMSTEVRIRIN
jgi:RND family efflux transporter MFP subunit